jgi:hypothetical protein
MLGVKVRVKISKFPLIVLVCSLFNDDFSVTQDYVA